MREIPFEKVCAWVFEAMLPFWAARGIYEAHDGFLEEVSQGGRANTKPGKAAANRVPADLCVFPCRVAGLCARECAVDARL